MTSWLRRIFMRNEDRLEEADEGQGKQPKCDPQDREEALVSSVESDAPINIPEEDLFGVDPFARAIAQSISTVDAREGVVYAVNGPWGSGKSSAINLILHHVRESVEAGKIVTSNFNPWWFSGAETLTLSFFLEMRSTIGKSVGENAREAMASLGGRLSSAGPLLGGLASLYATPAAGAAVTGAATLLEKMTHLESTVEKEHQKLSKALSRQSKKFLIVIDDIDRLNTDEALQIFKLIKSVGRLPGVIYLLAFDRGLAEDMVAARFPADGASYLEKVIQAHFDLPPPDTEDLKIQILKTVDQVIGSPNEEKMQRFFNIFHDAVAPLLKTPRDIVRLGNALKVSWPAVAGNVDRADFLALEAMRLFLPSVHRAIRAHPDMLTGAQRQEGHNRQSLVDEYDSLFLTQISTRQREVAKRALRRLFPRLDAVWGNTWNSGTQQWQRDRLVCSVHHFRTYFAFGLFADEISAVESDALVAGAGSAGATAAALRGFLAQPRRRSGTRAALALDELSVRAGDVDELHVEQLLIDIFRIADELNVDSDDERGVMGFGTNQIRIHWLLNNLLRDRFNLDFRSRIVRTAAGAASLEWLISLSSRCKEAKEKRSSNSDDGQESLVDDQTVDQLWELSLNRLREAAAVGSLAQCPRLEALLYRWGDRAGELEVRTWTDTQLDNDQFVVALARDVVRESWSHGIGSFGALGDRVALRTEYVNLEPLTALLDIVRFRERAMSLLKATETEPSDRAILERFSAARERSP